jgi:chromate reductase
MHDVAVFVGSLRRDSLNLKLARALAKLGKTRFSFNFAELGDLPIYNQDMEADLPASVVHEEGNRQGGCRPVRDART